MAFGTWFKKLGKKIVDGIKKVVPIAKKVGKVVKNTVAPILGTIGNAIGGKVGNAIGVASKVTGMAGDRTVSISDKVDNYIKTNGRAAVDDWIAHERNLGNRLIHPR